MLLLPSPTFSIRANAAPCVSVATDETDPAGPVLHFDFTTCAAYAAGWTVTIDVHTITGDTYTDVTPTLATPYGAANYTYPYSWTYTDTTTSDAGSGTFGPGPAPSPAPATHADLVDLRNITSLGLGLLVFLTGIMTVYAWRIRRG